MNRCRRNEQLALLWACLRQASPPLNPAHPQAQPESFRKGASAAWLPRSGEERTSHLQGPGQTSLKTCSGYCEYLPRGSFCRLQLCQDAVHTLGGSRPSSCRGRVDLQQSTLVGALVWLVFSPVTITRRNKPSQAV